MTNGQRGHPKMSNDMKNYTLRGVEARNEAEAVVEAQIGIEVEVKALQMPVMPMLKACIVCLRLNRHR
jgi:hypothetical protein